MLDLLFTSLLTSLLTLLGAWFFLSQHPKGVANPSASSIDASSDGNPADKTRDGEESLLEIDESDEEWLLQESGHQRPPQEVNASIAEIDAIRRSFTRDPPPHLEVSSKGRSGAKARAVSASSRPQSRARIHCRQCQKDFTDDIALRQHQVFKHSGAGPSHGGLPHRAPSSSAGGSLAVPRLTCDVCGRDCKTPSLLHQHKSDRHPWSTFCMKCRVKFTSATQATQHYKTAHMPRRKRSSPSRTPAESGNYVPFEGYHPDPNIPEIQQTYGCSECKERFNSAAERDAHMKDLFAHPDPVALASAFPPLSSAYPTANPSPPRREEEHALGLGIEISSRNGIALDRMPLSFQHMETVPRAIIGFDNDDHEDPPVHEIIIDAVKPTPPVAPLAPAALISSDEEIRVESPLENTIGLPPLSDSSSSILPSESASNAGDLETQSLSTSDHSSDLNDVSTLLSSSPSGSSRPWDSPQSIPTGDAVHPDAHIVWGVHWSPPVPGPESYPPLNGSLPAATPAIWGPPSATIPPPPTSPRLSESTVEETPPPETPPAPALPSPKIGTTPSRWSIGEKPAFPMPDLTPRVKQKLTFDPPVEEQKPDDLTTPYIHPSRLQQSFPLEETEQHFTEASVYITGPNNIPVSARKSSANHYRLGPNSQDPPPTASIYAAASGFTQVDLPPQNHARHHRIATIEEQLPFFRHAKEGEEFRGYPPPGPTPAPPRAAAIAAWSKPASKKESIPISYEPTVHASWLPPPAPQSSQPNSSSSSGDNGHYGKRSGRKHTQGRDTTPKKSKFFNTLEPAFDADEWVSEPMTRKKPVVKMQPRKESPAPRLTFAQRTAASRPTATHAVSRAAIPPGSQSWTTQQGTLNSASDDTDESGGW